jgi:hypothetical protein
MTALQAQPTLSTDDRFPRFSLVHRADLERQHGRFDPPATSQGMSGICANATPGSRGVST